MFNQKILLILLNILLFNHLTYTKNQNLNYSDTKTSHEEKQDGAKNLEYPATGIINAFQSQNPVTLKGLQEDFKELTKLFTNQLSNSQQDSKAQSSQPTRSYFSIPSVPTLTLPNFSIPDLGILATITSLKNRYWNQKTIHDFEINIEKALSEFKPFDYQTLQALKKDLENFEKNITLLHTKLTNEINKQKQLAIATYQNEINTKKDQFQAKQKQYEENFAQYTPEDQELHKTSHENRKTRIAHELEETLTQLDIEHQNTLTKLEIELTRIEKDHDDQTHNHAKKVREFEDLSFESAANALEIYFQYLKGIEALYTEQFEQNVKNISYDEHHKSCAGYLFGSSYKLQANSKNIICSDCLTEEGNLKAAILADTAISKEAQQALQFLAHQTKNLTSGFINKAHGLEFIKIGTDLRARKDINPEVSLVKRSEFYPKALSQENKDQSSHLVEEKIEKESTEQ